MSAVDQMNAVWKQLTDDAVFLAFFGLIPSSTIALKAGKVQKEMEPNGLTSTNNLMVCIFPATGLRSRYNPEVYDANFQADIFAPSLFTAMSIGKEIMRLLHNQTIAVSNTANFAIEFLNEASGSSGVTGVKKHSMRFEMSEVI